jgi:AraC-like DNA-binding protein/ligand-binding sensor protein
MSILSYDQIINLSVVQQFYYLAWRLFGVNIAIISPDRMHSLAINGKDGWSPFCIRLRQMGGEKYCVNCDRGHAELVGQQRKPLRYNCWAGLREVIVPIIVDNEILAFIQCGQVLDKPPTREDWQATRSILTGLGFNCEPLETLFMSQRVVPAQTQEDLMVLLELFGNYIADSQHRILLADASQRSRTEERAFSYIRNHYAESITLDDVANAACTSKRNLTRIFHANTGITVLSAIQDMRTEKAGVLLREGEMTCTQIANECGFGSIQQFNRVFKKIKKCTPQEWQRQHVRR